MSAMGPWELAARSQELAMQSDSDATERDETERDATGSRSGLDASRC